MEEELYYKMSKNEMLQHIVTEVLLVCGFEADLSLVGYIVLSEDGDLPKLETISRAVRKAKQEIEEGF
jgi:hypothetical protein